MYAIRSYYELLPSKADFELLLAASNLRYWADRVVESLTKEQLDVEPITLDVTQCRFGKWLESTKNRRYENAASFQKILAEHQALHELVTQTAERLKSEARTINPDETQQIRSAVHQLLDLLALLRHEIRITSYNVCYTKLLRIWNSAFDRPCNRRRWREAVCPVPQGKQIIS